MGLSLATISNATGQVQAQSSETEIWPEVDAHVQFPSHLRVLVFSGLEQGIGFPFQQWDETAALGYSVLNPHPAQQTGTLQKMTLNFYFGNTN